MSRTSEFIAALENATNGVIQRSLSQPQARPEELGAVKAARQIWAYSAAYKLSGDTRCLMMATKANDFFSEKFIDHKYGGVYTSLDSRDERLDTNKKTDIIASCIFCLAEYYSVTKDAETLRLAKELFNLVEKQLRTDAGYLEIVSRDWSEVVDGQTNVVCTFMHLLEGYANLYKVCKDPEVEESLRNLVPAVIGNFNVKNYGHFFSAGWLMVYVSNLLGDLELLVSVRDWAHKSIHSGFMSLAEDAKPALWIEGEAILAAVFMCKFNGCDKAAGKAFAHQEKLLADYPALADDLYHSTRLTLMLKQLI